jgi:hypothetical protein
VLAVQIASIPAQTAVIQYSLLLHPLAAAAADQTAVELAVAYLVGLVVVVQAALTVEVMLGVLAPLVKEIVAVTEMELAITPAVAVAAQARQAKTQAQVSLGLAGMAYRLPLLEHLLLVAVVGAAVVLTRAFAAPLEELVEEAMRLQHSTPLAMLAR